MEPFKSYSMRNEARLVRSLRRAVRVVASLSVACLAGCMPFPIVVAPPSLTPTGGVFSGSTQVTLGCDTPDAQVIYTTDGTPPSASHGTVYSGPIRLTQTTTIRAVACKYAAYESSEAVGTFIRREQVTDPVFAPTGGVFEGSVDVAMFCHTMGAVIRYTTDGSEPTLSNGTIYEGPLRLTDTTTLRAIAHKEEMTDSAVVTATFTRRAQADPPVFDPNGATFADSLDVRLSCATPGATVCYTLDGTTPSTSRGVLYSDPIHLTGTTTIKAIAWKWGILDSPVVTATFIRPEQVATPRFDPNGGAFIDGVDVTISCATVGATICYTTDGSTPSPAHGTIYSAPVRLTGAATVKAVAWKAGMDNSAIASAAFAPRERVATPTFTPNGGDFIDLVGVTIACATPGAEIRYTTDGTDPTPSGGTYYTGAVPLTSTTTVKAVAYAPGRVESTIASATFTRLPAGWSPMTSGVPDRLYGVWGTSSSNMYAVGNLGTLLHYDGNAWTPMVSRTAATLRCAWGPGAGDVYAGGLAGALVHYDGTIWSTLASGITRDICSIQGTGPSNVLLVATVGTIRRWDGSVWATHTSGTTNNLYGLWVASFNEAFAVGAAGTIRRYTGSTTWVTMTSGTTETLWGVWGASPYHVYAVGTNGTILRFNGSTWSGMTSGTTVELYWVWGNGPGDIFAVGQSGTILHYDGTSWSAMTSGTTSNLYCVWGCGPNDVYAVGDAGTILRYHR